MIRRWLAAYRLQRIVERNLNSYETRRYRERRQAAKLGWSRRRASC